MGGGEMLVDGDAVESGSADRGALPEGVGHEDRDHLGKGDPHVSVRERTGGKWGHRVGGGP